MNDYSSPASAPRRKRSVKSMAISDGEDPVGEGLKRVSIACTTCRRRKIRCDGRQPACTTCTKNRKTGCTYVRVTPEENLEVKARKRFAREQKAQYKALGIEPPTKLNVGRRRWEHNIRFEQQKLRGVAPVVQQQSPPPDLAACSPEGFNTSSWRFGGVGRAAIPHTVPVAVEERCGYFEQPERILMSSSPVGRLDAQPQAPTTYTFPPVKPLSGPMPAYTPYPLTPPMDEYQPAPRLDGNNALGLFSPTEPYSHSPWMPSGAVTSPPVFATSRVPSLRLQRSANFQPVPKPLTSVPPQPEPLQFVPAPPRPQPQPLQQQPQLVPYPSPNLSSRLLPVGLPASTTSPLLPPPAPLYAPNPTRPATTCDSVPQVAVTPPLSERDHSQPPFEQHDASSFAHSYGTLAGASTAPTTTVLTQTEFAQSDAHLAGLYEPASTATASAPPMFLSTSWNGSLYTPNARHVASYQVEPWQVAETHAHSTPELYSHTGW
ncbi:hypothetical protein JCM10908_004065 [Rhodotorula pacifica]|uniref:Zn(II)2Cys6 transcription factor domain-containing protein n=1 Tax=Rhodotorula pacifica TaxID=1495444 RepID=UPI00316B6EDC